MILCVSGIASAQTELRWKLHSGQELTVHVEQKTASDVAYSGKKVTTDINLSMELGWTVTAADEKAITIKQALKRLEEELADPSAWNDPRSAAKSTRRHEQAKKALQDLYAEWEAVAG